MPVPVDQAHPSRFDGPPRVVSLGFQITGGRFIGPRDMFADPSFDRARATANEVMDYLRRHGPIEPHRLPLDHARGHREARRSLDPDPRCRADRRPGMS
jgi:fructose 1,6-bisphosphate aldolase/phosphatase